MSHRCDEHFEKHCFMPACTWFAVCFLRDAWTQTQIDGRMDEP